LHSLGDIIVHGLGNIFSKIELFYNFAYLMPKVKDS
jgi:hypothetical protein